MVLSVFDSRDIAIGLACDRRESLWDGGLPDRCRGPGHFSLFGQRKVTKREATPMTRPCGVADGRRGGSTGRPALTIPWPASCRPPCGLFRLPPARVIGAKVNSQSDERSSLPVGAHPVRDRGASITSAVAHWVRSYKGRAALCAMCRAAARAFTHPLCGGEGWTIRPRRGARQGCRALFVRAGARSKSPAAPHGLAGRSPDSAMRGALLFGYFLLGKQEKVTRAAAAVREPAAGEHTATSQQSRTDETG